MTAVGLPAKFIESANNTSQSYLASEVSNTQDGLEMLKENKVYGVISADKEKHKIELWYSSVHGSSVLNYLRPLAQNIASKTNFSLSIRNTTPDIASNAAPGRSIFFAVFGTALTGFVLSQVLQPQSKRFNLGLGGKLITMSLVAMSSGLLVAIILDPWFRITQGVFFSAWLMVSLLCLAAASTGLALLELAGPLGQIITSVLFLALGNATSTGILPIEFLSAPFQ